MTWITRNCSSWLEFKAGFWFLIDFVRQKGVYWLASFELRLKLNDPLFCFALLHLHLHYRGYRANIDLRRIKTLIVFLGKTLALSFNIMDLPLLPEQCFRAGTTPNLTVWLPSECSATYNFQHLKCKDHTEAGQDDKMSSLFFSTFISNQNLNSMSELLWVIHWSKLQFSVNNYFKLNCHFSEHKF